MADRHYYATFTTVSEHFYLHSDPVKTRRRSGTETLNAIVEGKRTSLAGGNQQLLTGLKILAEYDEGVFRYVEQYRKLDEINFRGSRELRPLAKFHFLRSAFREIVGATVYRI